MIMNPPMCSLPSANGPSVVSMSPSRNRTTVAVLAECRPPPKTHAPVSISSRRRASMSAITLSRTSGGGRSPSG